MHLEHVISACNEHPSYMPHIPLFLQVWTTLFPQVRVTVLLIADSMPASIPDKWHKHLVLCPPISNVRTALHAQCIRILYPSILAATDEKGGILITDIDMLPTQTRVYLDTIHKVKGAQFACLPQWNLNREYNICYCVATPQTWRAIVGVETMDQARDTLVKWQAESQHDGHHGGVGWATDQRKLWEMVQSWNPDAVVQFSHNQLQFMRLDRCEAAWTDEQWVHLEAGRYTDCHLRRPNSKFASENLRVADIVCKRYGMIVSLCLWGDAEAYNYGALENALTIRERFPTARARFYVQTSTLLPRVLEALESLEHVEVVHMGGTQLLCSNMMWRFQCAFQHTGPVLVRDTDSLISNRERAAVLEWLQMRGDFHIMRDYPQHDSDIMGGMWGVRNGVGQQFLQSLHAFEEAETSRYGLDQAFLKQFVYPVAKGSCVIHASSHAREPGCLPFPVGPDTPGDFVGNILGHTPHAHAFLNEKPPNGHKPLGRQRNWWGGRAALHPAGGDEDVETPVHVGSCFQCSCEHALLVMQNCCGPEFVENASYIVEVGSGGGQSALELARAFGNARVFTFEADTRQQELCRQTISKCPTSAVSGRVHAVACAIGGKQERRTFYPYTRGCADASSFLQRTDGEQTQDKIKDVSIEALSDQALLLGIHAIDVLYVRVQGFELEVLQGVGDSLLSETRVIVVAMPRTEEHHSSLVGTSCTHSKYVGAPTRAELVKWLEKRGFIQRFVMFENDLEDIVMWVSSTGGGAAQTANEDDSGGGAHVLLD